MLRQYNDKYFFITIVFWFLSKIIEGEILNENKHEINENETVFKIWLIFDNFNDDEHPIRLSI